MGNGEWGIRARFHKQTYPFPIPHSLLPTPHSAPHLPSPFATPQATSSRPLRRIARCNKLSNLCRRPLRPQWSHRRKKRIRSRFVLPSLLSPSSLILSFIFALRRDPSDRFGLT